MGQRQGPQPEVRCSVRDTSKTEFDGVDNLMDDHLTEVVLLL